MIGIGILGCGTVASGVIELITTHKKTIKRQLGEEVVIRRVLARTPEKARRLGLTDEEICSDADTVIYDPEVSVVIELMGGVTAAHDCICKALKAKKHVVTANKDLVATRYRELIRLAEENGVGFAFEASVGGGIPLIDSIRRTLAANRIESILGILNGTTNYILTKMTREGLSYEEALSDAQALGFAEADPTSDVGGGDAARKIAILATLAFHTDVSYYDVWHEGIPGISPRDIRFASQSGYVFKLLAMAHQKHKVCQVCVRPALVPVSHPLASVSDSFNAVFLTGDAVGEVMLYGRGAGAKPTASSVVGDLMNLVSGKGAGLSTEGFAHLQLGDVADDENVYYVRVGVKDRPLVLSKVAAAFGKENVSLRSLVQETRGEDRAELFLFTHEASEGQLRRAAETLRAMDAVDEVAYWIVLEERA